MPKFNRQPLTQTEDYPVGISEWQEFKTYSIVHTTLLTKLLHHISVLKMFQKQDSNVERIELKLAMEVV